jgi:hypothetical protein
MIMTVDGNCHAILARGAEMGISLRESLVMIDGAAATPA